MHHLGPVFVANTFDDLIQERVGNDALRLLLRAVVSPGVSILVIVVVAVVLRHLAHRGIEHAAERMRDPQASRGTRLRRRVGLVDDDAEESLRREQRAASLSGLAKSIVTTVVWSIAFIMMLGQVGVHLGPLIAGAGIVGIALGFGAQDLVKDFLSGVFMLIEDQFGVGDIVDAGEAVGEVEGISLRSTRVRDVTGTLWHIPNGEIRRVGNMSQEWARALLDVEVAYDTDLDVAIELIGAVAETMAAEDEYAEVFLDTPAVWGVQDLAADGVLIRLVIKTLPGKQWAVTRELRRRLKRALDSAGIEIPFPQRTMWLRTEHPAALGGADTPVWPSPTPDAEVVRAAVDASAQRPPSTVEDVEAQSDAVGADEVAGDSGADGDDGR